MGQFQRKSEGSESDSGDVSRGGEERPDFGVLEPESGASAGELKKSQTAQEPTSPFRAPEMSSPAESSSRQSQPEPSRKRYYNPGEVMRKKGCIGCGGMALGVPVLMALTALLLTVF